MTISSWNQFINKCLFEIIERKQNNCDIIECLVSYRVFHNLFNDISTNLMNWLIFVPKVLLGCNPWLLYNFFICNLIKNTVTYKQKSDKVKQKIKRYLHPKSKKSILSSMTNSLISGVATTTFGFPPYFSRLASISPNVLETLSLPGNTL